MDVKRSSGVFMDLAQQIEERMKGSAGNEPQLRELRRVAGQCYFYAAINAIEEILEQKGGTRTTIRGHNHREKLIAENKAFFKNGNGILATYQKITGGIRDAVGYKGENGRKFNALRLFAEMCLKEL